MWLEVSAVIDACAKANDTERAQLIFMVMRHKGVNPTIVTYTSFARPFARHGMWLEVEQIASALVEQGLFVNEYFLNVLISAYAAAQPKQAQRAETAFRSACQSGIELNDYIVSSLEKCLGRSRVTELFQELNLKKPAKGERPQRSGKGGSKGGHRPQHRGKGGSG